MLLSMREKVKSSKVLKYVIILFICAPFALFGINSYFSNSSEAYAVKVNGEEIPVRMFEQEYNAQRNRLKQAFGGTIPAGFANDDMLRQQAVEGLISQRVLQNYIQTQNIVVSDESLAKAIRKTEAFQVDGKFDRERYELQLRSSGYSVAGFENQFRNDVALQDLRSSIIDSNFVLPQEQAITNQLNNQIRTIDYVEYKLAALIEEMVIEDEQVVDYHKENQSQFMHPQRFKLDYVEINAETVGADLDVTDDDASAYFEGNRDKYMVSEERSASHILISIADDSDDPAVQDKLKLAQSIKQKIDAGESFEDLVKEYSDDPGSSKENGSLGFFGRGAMVPEFETAVFDMQAGDISEPVKSNFGFHIIRLDEVKEEHGKSFKSVKETIVSLLKQQRVDDLFFDQKEKMANISFENPDSIIPLSESMGVDVAETDWVDSNTTEGIVANRNLQAELLKPEVLSGQINSDVIEVGVNHIVVVRVKEHEDERPKSLEDVKDQIIVILKRDHANSQLSEMVADAKIKFESGATVEELEALSDSDAANDLDLTRKYTDIDQAIVRTAFSMAKPVSETVASFGTVVLGSGNQVVIALRNVKNADVKAGDNDSESQNVDELPASGGAEFSALLRTLRDKAVVDINTQVLQPAAN